MSSIGKLPFAFPYPATTNPSDSTAAPTMSPGKANGSAPVVRATLNPFGIAPQNNYPHQHNPSLKQTSHAATPDTIPAISRANASNKSDNQSVSPSGTTSSDSSVHALQQRATELAQRENRLHEDSPSYTRKGNDDVRQLLVKHAADLGLSPQDAQHVYLDHLYWTEFEPPHLPSNGPIGYPPRPNPNAGKFVRSIPLSLVPITNLADTGLGDSRFHITSSNTSDQTADSVHDVIDPSKFAQFFKDENSESGGFKERYKRDVTTYFADHENDLRQYQKDKALLSLDVQEASEQTTDMKSGDYALLRQALQGQSQDASLKGQYHVYPLQVAGYVSPSALVITDERPHGATYLYLPGEPQPYLRFNDARAPKQYIENRTESSDAAHEFATTYFSHNDAAGGWNAIEPGVEKLFNAISDARLHPDQQQHNLLKFDAPLLTLEDKLIENHRDITDDPFGKQVGIAKDSALDQADFDITSEQDKTDDRRYEEAGKYSYIPFSEAIQLFFAKTGEQKREVFTNIALDAITTVSLDGLGKAFAPMAKNVTLSFEKQGVEAASVLTKDRPAPLPITDDGIVQRASAGMESITLPGDPRQYYAYRLTDLSLPRQLYTFDKNGQLTGASKSIIGSDRRLLGTKGGGEQPDTSASGGLPRGDDLLNLSNTQVQLGNLSTHDAYTDQFDQDAIIFLKKFRSEKPTSIINLPEDAKPENLIDETFKRHDGLIVGESHDQIAAKNFLIANMDKFKQQGAKTLYMEDLATTITPTQDLSGRSFTTAYGVDIKPLILAAQKHDITIEPLENDVFTLGNMDGRGRNPAIRDDMSYMRMARLNYYAQYKINNVSKGAHAPQKYVVLVGGAHNRTCDGIPGIADIFNVPSVLVDEKSNPRGYGISKGPYPNDFDMDVSNDYLKDKANGSVQFVKHPGFFSKYLHRLNLKSATASRG